MVRCNVDGDERREERNTGTERKRQRGKREGGRERERERRT